MSVQRTIKRVLRAWTPPAVATAARSWRRPAAVSFDPALPSWAGAARASSGYEAAPILDKVLVATRAVRDGRAVYERDSVLFDHVEYSFPVVATALRAAGEAGGRLSVIDFGGSLGSSFRECRPFLRDAVGELHWSVVEQPPFVEAGRREMQTDELTFFETLEEAHSAHGGDLVLLSAVLQYLESPHVFLQAAMALAPRYIVIDRTIVRAGPHDVAHVQHVRPPIYAATYPVWALSQSRLVDCLESRYELVSAYTSLPFPALAAIDAEFKGYVFKLKATL